MELFVYTINIGGNDLAALAVLPPEEVARYGLPSEAILGDVPARQPDMTVDTFTPNETFVLCLSNVIAEIGPDLPAVRRQAEKVVNGPVYVIDQRTVSQGGKPPFEDVIGWFGVRKGEILADTYNANPNYQLLSNAGPPQFDPAIEEKLLAVIRAIQRGERVETYAPEDEEAWWNEPDAA